VIYVRGTHPMHLRSGEWAHLFSIQHDADGRDLWVVEFPDGAKDVWPSWDAGAGYDVRVQIESPEPVEEPNGNQVVVTRSAARSAAQHILSQFT
jgi:hypothetical protein